VLNQKPLRDNSEKADAILLEMDALHAILQSVDHCEDSKQALGLIQRALLSPQTNRLIAASMRRILGQAIEAPGELLASETYSKHLYEGLVQIWLLWASGRNQEAKKVLGSLHLAEQAFAVLQHQKGSGLTHGAVHIFALQYWFGALEALVHENLAETHRLWKRSIEIGSSHGTKTSAAILWAYAATFFRT
jgi:hypothetical protein